MYKRNASIRQPGVQRYSKAQPSFRERRYRRPLIMRLRPFTWFLVILSMLAAVGIVATVWNRGTQKHEESISLSDWPALAAVAQPQAGIIQGITTTGVGAVVVSSTITEQVATAVTVTVQPTAEDVITATIHATVTPTPTYDASSAPWLNQLTKQSDNTLQVPEEVQARIRKELGEYYQLLRDLPFAVYKVKRDTILSTYFTGTSLKQMLRMETNRTQYLLNRAGTITMQVRDFSADGYAATVGIRASGWVNDVYDASTGKLVIKERLEKDTFTIVRIIFERVSDRWKFMTVKLVTEVTKP